MGIFREDEGTGGITMRVAWKCETQSQGVGDKHWVWMWGMGEEEGTSSCYRVFSAAVSVLASQPAVSQTEFWLCFLQVKADRHSLWHGLRSNQGNGNWSLE